MPRVLAVDPGSVSAAYGFITLGIPGMGMTAQADDVPVSDRMVNAAEWSRIVRQLQPDMAVIEQVSAMPRQGISSAFRFGQGVGLLRGVLAGAEIPIIQITPAKWKKHFRLSADKEEARALAIRRFPQVSGLHLKKHAGRAEALLMALWHIETTR